MIECRNVIKEFATQRILHGISMQIADGEFVSISGRSGSGKSTLLYLISSLDQPSAGEVWIEGKNIAAMSSAEVHAFRNRHVGFIFQFHFLLPELTALENVLLPARNIGQAAELTGRALEWLGRLGIAPQAHKFPGQMSGGEQQRVAIARALILGPKYIFADEPTGNLDTENAEAVMRILQEVNSAGATVCLVTHDPDFSRLAQREIFLVDGRISRETRVINQK